MIVTRGNNRVTEVSCTKLHQQLLKDLWST
jgi:hypothetical protein